MSSSGQGFLQTFRTQLRWMQSTRFSRPKGHLGTVLTFLHAFRVAGLVFGGLARVLADSALRSSGGRVLTACIQAVAVGWGIIRDRRALRLCWLYPLRDLLGFFVWVTSYLCGSEFTWRGESYRFSEDGRFVPLSRGYIVPETAPAEAQPSLVSKTSI